MPKKPKGILTDQDFARISQVIHEAVKNEVGAEILGVQKDVQAVRKEIKLDSMSLRDYVDSRFSALNVSLDNRFSALEDNMKNYTHTYVGEAVETIMTGMDSLTALITKKDKIAH